jgi:replication fork clamp-binding protein CrfC
MKNLVEEARTCHGEHTTHGKFIQRLADRIEELEVYSSDLEAELQETQDRANAFATKEYYTEMRAERAEAKLAKVVEALDWVKYGGGPKGESAHMKACETLDALKGEKDE